MMGSDESSITPKRITPLLQRAYVAFLTNRKCTFLVSFILATIFYSPIYISSSNNSNQKRYGLGGPSASASELTSALRRKSDGRAAVAIIRVVGMQTEHGIKSNPNNEVQYLVQYKSHDYPIKAFRGAVCLLGGNASGDTTKKKLGKKGMVGGDVTPLDTLKRELNEELMSPDWVNVIQEKNVIDDSKLGKTLYNTTSLPAVTNNNEESDNANNMFEAGRIPGTVRYLGTTLHSHTAELIDRPKPYAFLCALYEITIGIDQLPHAILHPVGATVQEGRLALLTQEQLLQHAKYSWGYEYTMEAYFGRKSWNKQEGASVSEVDENIWETTSWTPPK
mmetsp:Transcript_17630/g.26213  ORF Transcript_17630/g.26213 Transcript_17630/m.26213 type:complete len:335 (-) Transcript_17630:109-1113(-)